MLRAVRRVLTTVLVSSVLLLTSWVAPAPASACSCAGGTTAEQFDRADAVFTGTLLSREVQHPAGAVHGSDDPAVHVFALDVRYKGTASARQQVVSPDSGASCGLELTGDGPFLVFATDPADAPEGQLAAGLCGGTAPSTPELTAEVAQLAASTGPVVYDRRPIGDEMSADESPAWTPLALEIGAAVLALLAGVLAVRRRRRLERPTTVVVLTRD